MLGRLSLFLMTVPFLLLSLACAAFSPPHTTITKSEEPLDVLPVGELWGNKEVLEEYDFGDVLLRVSSLEDVSENGNYGSVFVVERINIANAGSWTSRASVEERFLYHFPEEGLPTLFEDLNRPTTLNEHPGPDWQRRPFRTLSYGVEIVVNENGVSLRLVR